jgi:predicted enzyme related to lactoylglutathione lyase
MSKLSSFFISKPYIRVFVKVADCPAFVKNYLENFEARLEYVVDIPRLNNLQVVGIESPHGNVSAVVTDSLSGFPDYLVRTKLLYKTDDTAATLQAARAAGMKVLQEKTPVPIGFQGRFEMPGGYVIELFEISSEGERYLNPDPVKFGFARDVTVTKRIATKLSAWVRLVFGFQRDETVSSIRA